MSSRKMGRPTNNPKIYEIKVKMSSDDMNKLNYLKTKTEQTISDIVRNGISIQYDKIKE